MDKEKVEHTWGELFFVSLMLIVMGPLIGGATAVLCLVVLLSDKPLMLVRQINKWLGVRK